MAEDPVIEFLEKRFDLEGDRVVNDLLAIWPIMLDHVGGVLKSGGYSDFIRLFLFADEDAFEAPTLEKEYSEALEKAARAIVYDAVLSDTVRRRLEEIKDRGEDIDLPAAAVALYERAMMALGQLNRIVMNYLREEITRMIAEYTFRHQRVPADKSDVDHVREELKNAPEGAYVSHRFERLSSAVEKIDEEIQEFVEQKARGFEEGGHRGSPGMLGEGNEDPLWEKWILLEAELFKS